MIGLMGPTANAVAASGTKHMDTIIYQYRQQPYLTCTLPSGWVLPVDGNQSSGRQVGPLCILVMPEAIEISQKFWQASGAKDKICYLNQCNAYSKDAEV